MNEGPPPPPPAGSPIKMVVGLLATIVVLLAVLIGVLLQRRAAAPEPEGAGETPAVESANRTGTEPPVTPVTTETAPAKTEGAETPAPAAADDPKLLKKKLERDTLQTEVENQLLDARSKLARALKLAHRRPGRALGELLLVERLLEALPELAEEHTVHNTEAENAELLKAMQPQVEQVRTAVLATRCMALRLRGAAKDLEAARAALDAGLKAAKGEARALLEVESALLHAAAGEVEQARAGLKTVLKRDPKHTQALVALADIEEKAGDLKAAAALLGRAVLLSPDQALPLRRLGRLQLAAGAYEGAIETYDQLLKLNDMDGAAYLGRARAERASGRLEESTDSCTQAIDIDPRPAEGYCERGLTYLAQRKLARAVKDFEVAISRDAGFAPARVGLGRALELMGESERALATFLIAARSESVRDEALARLARHYLWRADAALGAAEGTKRSERLRALRSAQAASDRVPKHPVSALVRHRLAEAKTARTASDEEVDEAVFLIAEGKRYAGLARRSGKRTYALSALRAFSMAWTLDPARAVEASLAFGRLALERGMCDAAALAASAALRRAPKSAQALLLRGLALGTAPTPASDRALEALNRALQHAADAKTRLRIHLAIARTHLAGGTGPKRLSAARGALAKAAGQIPDDALQLREGITDAWTVVTEWERVCGQLLDDAGKKQARAAAARLRRLTQGEASKLLIQARKKRDRLDYSGAIKLYDKVVRLDPRCADAYYDRGTCYLKIGNFIPGILDFSRSLELNPRHADLVFNKVYQISYVVDLNRVIAEMTKLVADYGASSYVVFMRGFFFVASIESNRLGKKAKVPDAVKRGIADFDRALALNPEHVTAFSYRGFLKTHLAVATADLKQREGHFNEALADLRAAKRLDPGSQVNGYLHAYLLLRRAEGQTGATAEGMRTEAIAKLKEAFKAGFKGRERLKNERAFDPIRNHPEVQALLRR